MNPNDMVVCAECLQAKPMSDFHKRSRSSGGGIQTRCRICRNTANTAYYHANKNTILAKLVDKKLRMVEAYGGRCACPGCDVTEPAFLTLDHIDGKGAMHRRNHPGQRQIYNWVEKHGYPNGFQLLCANCHLAKSYRGGCPHVLQCQ